MFLPEAFHSERDSILALLRFKRVPFKAQVLQNFVKGRLTSQLGQASGNQEGTIMAACGMCDKLTWVSATVCAIDSSTALADAVSHNSLDFRVHCTNLTPLRGHLTA